MVWTLGIVLGEDRHVDMRARTVFFFFASPWEGEGISSAPVTKIFLNCSKKFRKKIECS